MLVRVETRPEDLPALTASSAVVSWRGGRTSHAAVVARATDRPCVVGLFDADLDPALGVLTFAAGTVKDGDLITVDGDDGVIAHGDLTDAEEAAPNAGGALATATARLVDAADQVARMAVWANADTAHDAQRARAAGAAGIGLCRTEHMFLGARKALLTEILVGARDANALDALEALHRLQRSDFNALLAAMDGRPVTVRLLDPPRHEFLPDLVELAVEAATARAVGAARPPAADRLLRAVERLTERNPMLGVRGARLGVLLPWLYEMQIEALLEATLEQLHAGGDPRPQVLVLMVSDARELSHVRTVVQLTVDRLRPFADSALTVPVGAMIETPRAALTPPNSPGVQTSSRSAQTTSLSSRGHCRATTPRRRW